MQPCPCGSGADYLVCCAPIIQGETPAPTALALMRSRYTAYALGEIEHLTASLHPSSRHDHDPAAARRWSEQSRWLGLEIRVCEQGGPEDDSGSVEFVARYRDRKGPHQYHEIARFCREDGQWYYLEGKSPAPRTQTRETTKVGRNDPCPCGSGLKHKKCCGV